MHMQQHMCARVRVFCVCACALVCVLVCGQGIGVAKGMSLVPWPVSWKCTAKTACVSVWEVLDDDPSTFGISGQVQEFTSFILAHSDPAERFHAYNNEKVAVFIRMSVDSDIVFDV